jgi:hypothetical protein
MESLEISSLRLLQHAVAHRRTPILPTQNLGPGLVARLTDRVTVSDLEERCWINKTSFVATENHVILIS